MLNKKFGRLKMINRISNQRDMIKCNKQKNSQISNINKKVIRKIKNKKCISKYQNKKKYMLQKKKRINIMNPPNKQIMKQRKK